MSKRTSPMQPDHLGRHSPVAVHSGMVVSHASHNDAAQRGGDGGIGCDGKPKHVQPVPVAAGMHRVTGTSEGAPKIETLSSIPDASSPLASDPTKYGKRIAVPAPVIGQRSRSGDSLGGNRVGANHSAAMARADRDHAARVDLGNRIIGEALAAAEPDHPAIFGAK
jgi:hypothetical protein